MTNLLGLLPYLLIEIHNRLRELLNCIIMLKYNIKYLIFIKYTLLLNFTFFSLKA